MMPKYLLKQRQGWYAVLEIPKALQKIFGKKRFKLTLETDSLTIAKQRVLPVIAGWKREIEVARSNTETIGDKVFTWRRLAEESRREGLSDDEIVGQSLDVLDRSDPDAEIVHQITFGKKILLKEHIPSYVASLKSEQKTVDMVHSDLRRLTSIFKLADQATKKTLINWVENDLIAQEGLSLATCRRIISSCRGYWRYLERHTDLEIPSPFEGVVPSASRKKTKDEIRGKRKSFTPRDYQLLIQNVPRKDVDLHNLIMLGAYTGCRIEELCSLKIDKVHKNYFEIDDAKTESGWRLIPLHPSINSLVNSLKANSKDSYLLAGLSFNRYGDRSNAIGKRFGRLKKKLGYGDDYVFHSFRKGVATQLEAAGIAENISARLLGHELKTMSYGHYSAGLPLEVLAQAINHLKWDN